MEDLSKNILINDLFYIYGELLSSTQKKMIELYYSMDLSLSEIAQNEGVSRNAVFDAIKKGSDALINYESKMHLLEKKEKLNKNLEILKTKLSSEDYLLVEDLLKED